MHAEQANLLNDKNGSMMMIGVILEGRRAHGIIMMCDHSLLLSYAENHDDVDGDVN